MNHSPSTTTVPASSPLREAIRSAVESVRADTPLAQSFTNFVTINLVANAQLAAGGTAAMSFLPDDVVDIARHPERVVVQDRTIFEDARIFAPNLHRMGRMSDRDFDTYTEMFDLMMSLVKLPDLMIYIRSGVPNLVNQIAKRGREYEKTMGIDFLLGLNELYEEWIKQYPGQLLIIDGDTMKFESDPEAFGYITEQIDRRLFGIFPEED